MHTVYIMYAVYIGCLLFLSSCSVFLMSQSLYLLFPYVFLKLFGEKTQGYIKIYHMKKYYTKSRPRRLHTVYYPEIEAFVDGKIICNTIDTVKNTYCQEYQIGDPVTLLIGTWNINQVAIDRDFRKITSIIKFVIALYFVWLIFNIEQDIPFLYQNIVISCNISLCIFAFIFFVNLGIFTKNNMLSRKISKKYCFINLLIYVIVFFAINILYAL